MTPRLINPLRSNQRQRGAALLIALLILVLGLVTLLTLRGGQKAPELEADHQTALALAQAKAALVGFAAGVDLSGSARPGDLPCPDLNNDGLAELSCGNASGSTGQDKRLGRLPWKTLGLPDLRDGHGERLWYAVSSNFKNNTRIPILNSDTQGTITVRDSKGNVILDAAGTTGAIAVIIAPGAALTRKEMNGSLYVQNRACIPCDAQEKCTATPAIDTPRCNPINFLDIALGEDNKSYIDGDADGFVQGSIKDASGAPVLNDKLLAITYDDLMPVVEKRVSREVLFCLTNYAADISNSGRYPWAAPLSSTAPPSFADMANTRFGRIPDTPFTSTVTSSGTTQPMNDNWSNCNIVSGSGWWLNWKEMVFYALGSAYQPIDLSVSPVYGCSVFGACLVVNPPSPIASKQVVVFVAGRRLKGVAGGQPRTSNIDKGEIANYLEKQNASTADGIFERGLIGSTFNDVTSFAP